MGKRGGGVPLKHPVTGKVKSRHEWAAMLNISTSGLATRAHKHGWNNPKTFEPAKKIHQRTIDRTGIKAPTIGAVIKTGKAKVHKRFERGLFCIKKRTECKNYMTCLDHRLEYETHSEHYKADGSCYVTAEFVSRIPTMSSMGQATERNACNLKALDARSKSALYEVANKLKEVNKDLPESHNALLWRCGP